MAPLFYRKRLIPEETILLKSDILVYLDSDVVVSKWKPIKPREDIGFGESVYFIRNGYKISKFYNSEGVFIYWYCDIIDTEYDESKDTYIFTDLLADVIIMPDGFVKVLDLDEFSVALENNLITIEQLKKSLNRLNSLLEIIYSNKFEELVSKYFNKIEKATITNVNKEKNSAVDLQF